jgi:hypothetical protein
MGKKREVSDGEVPLIRLNPICYLSQIIIHTYNDTTVVWKEK